MRFAAGLRDGVRVTDGTRTPSGAVRGSALAFFDDERVASPVRVLVRVTDDDGVGTFVGVFDGVPDGVPDLEGVIVGVPVLDDVDVFAPVLLDVAVGALDLVLWGVVRGVGRRESIAS